MNSLHRTICQFPDRSLPLFRPGVPLFLRTFQFLRMLNLLEPCDRGIYDCHLCVLSSLKDFRELPTYLRVDLIDKMNQNTTISQFVTFVEIRLVNLIITY